MASRLGYTISLPGLGAPDVEIRRLTIAVDGDSTDVEIKKDANGNFSQVYEIVVDQEKDVVVTLVDVDDAGNESEPSDELRFTSADETPPSKPGALAIVGAPRSVPDDSTPVPDDGDVTVPDDDGDLSLPPTPDDGGDVPLPPTPTPLPEPNPGFPVDGGDVSPTPNPELPAEGDTTVPGTDPAVDPAVSPDLPTPPAPDETGPEMPPAPK